MYSIFTPVGRCEEVDRGRSRRGRGLSYLCKLAQHLCLTFLLRLHALFHLSALGEALFLRLSALGDALLFHPLKHLDH